MSLWLTDDELYELTGYWQTDKRIGALVELNIKFRRRPADGFILVERHLFQGQQQRKREPNLAAIRG